MVHPSAFVLNGLRLVVVATPGWRNGPLLSMRSDDDDDDLSSCCWLLLPSSPSVRKSTELLRHKTPDFAPDVASQQTRPHFCTLQIIESHSGMHLLETARDVKHRWWTVVINRLTYYISQGRVETPSGEVGNYVAVLLQIYFSICVKKNSKNNAVWQSYCKHKVCNCLPHSVDEVICTIFRKRWNTRQITDNNCKTA